MPDRDPGGDWYDGKPSGLPSLVKSLENALSAERFIDGYVTRLYYGQGILPTGALPALSGITPASAYITALSAMNEENIMASAMNAAVSMLLRKPAFKVITEGGSWRQNVAARKMSRLMTGVYSTSGLDGVTRNILLDSMRCQVAASKWVMSPKGQLRCERVLPHTLVWNPTEGPDPRNIYERHGVPRSRLMRQFPELADAIKERAVRYVPDAAFHLDAYVPTHERDLVEVVEGWRRAEDDDPGRHVMFISGLEDPVADDEWTLPFWPIVPLRWGDSYDTLAGFPLGRRLLSFQRTINRMDRTIDEAQSKACPPKLLVPKGSEVAGWDNSIGGRIDYNAAAGVPQIVPGQALPAEYYTRFQQKKSAAYELCGVSQSLAEGTKDPGLNSGRAQRERYDIANSLLVQDAQALERWLGDNARVVIAMMKHAYEGSAKMRKLAPNTRLLEEIDWSQVPDAREDELQVRAFITSAIPISPAGRAETISDWVSQGVLTQARAARWYADPDVARLEDEDSATEDLVRKLIESALDDGVYLAPEPILGPDGLAMVVSLGSKDLMQALTMREPPPAGNLELLRRLIAEAQLMMQPPPAPPGPAAPQLAPPAAGVPPGAPGDGSGTVAPGAPPPGAGPPA